MKYAVEMGYMPNFTKMGSGIPKFRGGEYTDDGMEIA
jgi:hypothetical protein